MEGLLKGGGSQLINYDFNDIKNGLGYTTYYGAKVTSGAITDHILSSDVIDSIHVRSNASGKSSSFSSGALISLSFAMSFNVPSNMNGTIYSSIPFAWRNTTTTNGEQYILNLSIYKNNTLIASGASVYIHSLDSDTDGVNSAVKVPIIIDLPNLVHFKINDELIANVRVYGQAGSAVTHYIGIGHSPSAMADNDLLDEVWEADTAGTTANFLATNPITTDTKFQIKFPFKLDV